jgi:hypothetical protein
MTDTTAPEIDDDDPPLFDRYTLFFDFLGSSMATSWPKDRLYPFLDLLITIAGGMQTAQNIEGNAQEDGSYRFQITPDVTAFSDNIVVSYPSPKIGDDILPYDAPAHSALDAFWAKFMCQDAIRILSGVAEMGLRIGVLLRGGFSFGQLYHDSGVVFGEAMVDAHRLENKLACYPRVLVSDRIIARLADIPEAERRTFLLQDTDGRWHLNYIATMRRHASNGPLTQEMGTRWKEAHLATIDAAIDASNSIANDPLAGDDARKEARKVAGKWIWFKGQFEMETADI